MKDYFKIRHFYSFYNVCVYALLVLVLNACSEKSNTLGIGTATMNMGDTTKYIVKKDISIDSRRSQYVGSCAEVMPIKDEETITKYREPQFPGGEDSLYVFIKRHRTIFDQQYPSKGPTSSVVVLFDVDTNGSIENIHTGDREFDHTKQFLEIKRIIYLMPKLIPASELNKNGKRVFEKAECYIFFDLPPY